MNIGTIIESKYMGREDDTKLGRNIQKEDRIKENIHLEEEIKIVPHMPGVPYLPSPAPHIPIPAINPGMSHHYKQLIETIQDCEAICEHMTALLKEKHDFHLRKIQYALLHNCSDICTLMTKYLGRNSMFSKVLANKCAFVCEACGNECEKFKDPDSQDCARICLECARECKIFAM